MPVYAKINNREVVEYPFTLHDLRTEFPNTSFPTVLESTDLTEYGVVTVQEASIQYDPTTQIAEEIFPKEVGGKWVQQWRIVEKPEGEAIAQLQFQLKSTATAHRWAVETGGITLPNGISVKTGSEDQARITSVIANARLAGVTSVDFKAVSGWITLTLAEIESIAGAIALHVQACFAAERAHHEAINSSNYPELLSYDVEKFWPSNLMT